MPSKPEVFLLKELARTYAFILDIRNEALKRNNQYWIVRTKGVEEVVSLIKEKYPKVFSRYLNKALKKGHEQRQLRTSQASDSKKTAEHKGKRKKKTAPERKN